MIAIETPRRLSPIHDELEHLHVRFVDVEGMPVAVSYGDGAKEKTAAADLGLCDVSFLSRVTLKGPAAVSVLNSKQIAVPEKVLDVASVHGGGIVARTGATEFFVEDGLRGINVQQVATAARETGGCYIATRQDASFLLSGKRAVEVFLETCGYDFRQPPKQIVFTRVVGVSCSILHRDFGGVGAFQLWLDGSYGGYLWETLLEIVRELNGAAVGAGAFYDDLATK
jgi:sarcosine oxidase, subunit gamma